MSIVKDLVYSILEISRRSALPFAKLPLPVFVLLYAKKTGRLSDIHLQDDSIVIENETVHNEFEDELYNSLRYAMQLYSRTFRVLGDNIVDLLNKYDDTSFRLIYCDLIEELFIHMAKYSSHYMGEFMQPSSVTCLVSKLLEKINPRRIYNPFAGLSSIAVATDYPYLGQEKMESTCLLAKIRLDAHGKDISSIKRDDSIEHWHDWVAEADTLVSTPPFGGKYNFSDIEYYRFRYVCEYVLYQFSTSPVLETAVLIMPLSVCFTKDYYNIRKIVGGSIDMVISLPSGIFYGGSVSSVALVLNKYREDAPIAFVDATSCLKEDKDLDVEGVLNLIESRDNRYVTQCCYEDIVNRDYSWLPSNYIKYHVQLEDGQEEIKLSHLMIPGNPISSSADTGIILSPEDFYDDINTSFAAFTPDKGKISANMKAYEGEHLVLSILKQKIKVRRCQFTEPFYLNQNQIAFKLADNSPVSMDYLEYVLLRSKSLQMLVKLVNGVSIRVIRQLVNQILDCNVAFYRDPNKQISIIESLKNQYTREKRLALQAEMQRLGIRDASSDLSHVLGTPFHKVQSALDLLQCEDIPEELQRPLSTIRDNIQYMKRMIKILGADFENIKLKNKNIKVNDFINSYLQSWNNLEFNWFSLEYHPNVSDYTLIKADEDFLRVVFDAILRNAYKHGFKDMDSSDNKVEIITSFVNYDSREYLLVEIANNGTPFPVEFSIEKFIKRGACYGATGNTGLGGNHVYSIIKRLNGFLNISSNQVWGTIIQMLIPVELYEDVDADKFVDYDGAETCI